MTWEETLAFIYETGNKSRPGLSRISDLLARLGNPQDGLRFVHVAGTNGKGSVSAMIASVLRAAGYRTGLYTSPHLRRVTERMRIDGREIDRDSLGALAAALAPHIAQMADKPTEFERLTAMALLWFARQSCDVVVLEVGLGGRFDATNVIRAPEVSVITAIGLDHTEWLGDTPEQIAREKGGVVKPGRQVVLCGQSPAVEAEIRAVCREQSAPLRVSGQPRLLSRTLEGQRFDYGAHSALFLPLLGEYQLKNAAVALDALDTLVHSRGFSIPEASLRAGFAETVWPARLEVLSREPLVLLDGAHNPDGAAQLAASLRALLPNSRFTFVMGVLADKDYREMLRLLAPLAARLIATAPDSPRALPSAALTEAAQAAGIPAQDGETIAHAIPLALQLAEGSPVCVCGSLYQAGEARAYFGLDS